ncbi:MAG: hypothetical protein ACOYT4_02760 [Nanoarchaeota archaeon]
MISKTKYDEIRNSNPKLDDPVIICSYLDEGAKLFTEGKFRYFDKLRRKDGTFEEVLDKEVNFQI